MSELQEERSQVSLPPQFLAQPASAGTHRAGRRAPEKAQEVAPHAPAGGKGDELEKQRMLPDSGGSRSSFFALSTDPAAIPGNLCLPHLEDRSGTSVHETGGMDSPEGREKDQLHRQVGSAAGPYSSKLTSGHVWGYGNRRVEGKMQIPESQGAVPGAERRGTLSDRPSGIKTGIQSINSGDPWE